MDSYSNDQGWTTVSYKKNRTEKENRPKQTEPRMHQQKDQSSFYDDNTIIIKKKTKPQTVKVERKTQPNSHQVSNISQYHHKIETAADSEDVSFNQHNYPPKFRAKLLDMRMKLNLNRKEFAQKLNIKESIIKGIENNTETYDPNTMSKLSHELQKLENHSEDKN